MAFPFYQQHWIDVDERRMEAYSVLLQHHPPMEPMLAPLELVPGLSVLDVGCGPGYVTADADLNWRASHRGTGLARHRLEIHLP